MLAREVANLNNCNRSGCAAVHIKVFVSRIINAVLIRHFTGRKERHCNMFCFMQNEPKPVKVESGYTRLKWILDSENA